MANFPSPPFFFLCNRYMMIILFPILYFGWKFIKKTKVKKPHEIDLQEDLEEIEEYTRNFVEVEETNKFVRVLDKLFT